MSNFENSIIGSLVEHDGEIQLHESHRAMAGAGKAHVIKAERLTKGFMK
jgi:hypothetical protein